jgi:hypothetical protein
MLEILAIYNYLPSEPARPHQYLFYRSLDVKQTIAIYTKK